MARTMATLSAASDKKNARTPGRSALAQSWLNVEKTLTAGNLHGDAHGIHDLAQDRFGSFRLFLQRSVPRAGHHAMRKDGHRQVLEVVRQTKVAAFEKGARLRRALQHQCATRAHAQRQ